MHSPKLPWRVNSLKNLSLKCIARNIKFWTDHMPENPDSCLYILSPFEILGTALSQDVLNTLVEIEHFKSPMLHLLLHPSMVSLDLSGCLKLHNVGDSALKILYKRCRKIRQLNVLGKTRLCAINVLHRLPTSPFSHNLSDLRITHDSITDTFMESLAQNCKKLTCLHILSCRKLTPSGFSQIEKLQVLEDLHLGINHFPNFTDKVLMSLLQGLTKLKSLSLSMARINLHALHKAECSIPNSLLRLHLECTFVDDVSVDLITSTFTRLKDLSITHSPGVTVDSLPFLNRCILSNLEISDTGIMEFTPDFLDTLKIYGLHLHKLHLSGIKGVDLARIATLCPFLESLSLCQCYALQSPWIHQEDVIFRQHRNRNTMSMNDISVCEICVNLNTLLLDCVGLEPPGDENFQLESILRGANNIQTLSLVGIPSLSDDKLEQLLELFCCSSVKHFDISQNRNVTVNGIYHVLGKCSNLRTLQIAKCDIVRQEYSDLTKLLERHRADVTVNNIEFW